MRVQERFLRYINIDTTSDETCADCPSSKDQWVLARELEQEMKV